jgi:WD40 repeat protein
MADRFDLFAEHHPVDCDRVRPLVAGLSEEGLDLWFEPWSIQPGDPIQFSRIDGLERSDALLAFLSSTSLAAGGLERRVTLFQATGGRRPVLLVRLDDTEVPAALRALPTVDQSSDRPDPAALLEAVRKLGPADFEEVWSGRRDRASIWALAAPGRLLVSLSQRGVLRGWAQAEGRPRWETTVHGGAGPRCYGLAVSERGIVATSSYARREARILGLHSRETVRVFPLASSYDLAWLDDGRTLAAATEDGLLVVDARSGEVRRSIGKDAAYRVVVGEAGIWAADSFRGTRGQIRGWTREGSASGRLRADDSPVRSLALHPSEPLLAAGSEDGKIRLWDLRTTTVRRVFEGHTTRVEALAWLSPDELVSASWDRTLRGWNPKSARPTRRTAVGGTALALVAVPAKRLVAVGLGGGTVSLRRSDALDPSLD